MAVTRLAFVAATPCCKPDIVIKKNRFLLAPVFGYFVDGSSIWQIKIKQYQYAYYAAQGQT